ncbi:MAG: 6-carboxyhexanoate--CoA ligase [Desulfovibrio sp.]|nr:6-carboxyhexanoate--CoA ligase [Desulfovibrio sp.]
MRARQGSQHISGAERLVQQDAVVEAIAALTRRALSHPKGAPDELIFTVQALKASVETIPPLPVTVAQTQNPNQARSRLAEELRHIGLSPAPVLSLLYGVTAMRGAILLDADTLRRLEPDQERGVRASCMDWPGPRAERKEHALEALCLASKVAHCPWIVGELCISDDPDYTTGYFASCQRGYVRIPHIKEPNSPRGGRIFLYRGRQEDVGACIRWLESRPILVDMR